MTVALYRGVILTTQMWASDFAFKADNFCRGRMHYKFCPSPRADALQVLAPSERAWAVQRSRCRAFLVFDASVPDA